MYVSSPSLAFFILGIAFLFACSKGENPPIRQQNIWDCHHASNWDAARTEAELLGEWEWEFISCFWTPEAANGEEFEGLTVEFLTDRTLIVQEDGQTTQTATWKVIDGDADLFAVETDPVVPQLYGRILFCKKRVKFNHSYIDGCDNYFKRVE